MKKKVIIDQVLFWLVFCIFLFTRIYLLDRVPLGLHVDEAGMAYDAWSLSEFGVDRYLNRFPVYFINFGGGQSIMYGYISMILIKLLGLSIYSIRLPGVIISILAFYIIYKTSIVIFKSKKYSLISSYLFTILPYFIMQSRFGLDCNLMMGFSSIVIYSIHKMIETNQTKFYIIGGVCTGLILYTYALSYLSIPIFLILVILYLIVIKKFNFKKMVYFSIVLGLFATPLIIMVIINKLDLESVNFLGFTIPIIPEFRGSEIVISNIVPNFKHVIKSVLMYDWLPYNTFEQYYTMFKISIPFVFIGVLSGIYSIIVNLKNRRYSLIDIVWFFALSVFIMGLFLDGQPNTNRLNGIMYSVLILIVYGIFTLENILVNTIKGTKVKKIYTIFIILIYSLSFLDFSNYYYFKYAYDKYPQTLFTHLYTEEIQYIDNINKEQKMVFIEKNIRGYIYFLLSTKTSPFIYNNEKNGEIMFRNYFFDLPEEINEQSYYLVLKTNYGFNERIKNLDFKRVEFEFYNLYLPISQ